MSVGPNMVVSCVGFPERLSGLKRVPTTKQPLPCVDSPEVWFGSQLPAIPFPPRIFKGPGIPCISLKALFKGISFVSSKAPTFLRLRGNQAEFAHGSHPSPVAKCEQAVPVGSGLLWDVPRWVVSPRFSQGFPVLSFPPPPQGHPPPPHHEHQAPLPPRPPDHPLSSRVG